MIRLTTSFRRHLLDRALSQAAASMTGTVVDVGGEWRHRRGSFRPPQRADLHWICLNIAPEVAPDVVADVACVPLADACADAIVCTEVLEHVWSPKKVLAEAYRLLRPDGQLILSTPFLAPVHADPHDYQRYTAFKLEQMLQAAGFTTVEIRPQGLYFTVLAEMIRSGLARLRPTLVRWAVALLMLPLIGLLLYLDHRPWAARSPYLSSYTTGYFVVAAKRNDRDSVRDSVHDEENHSVRQLRH